MYDICTLTGNGNISIEGWKYVLEYNKQIIFVSKDEGSTKEVINDNMAKLQTVKDAMSGSFMVIHALIVFFFLLQYILLGPPFSNSDIPVLKLALCLFYAIPVFCLIIMLMYGIWSKVSEKNINRGKNFASTMAIHWIAEIYVIALLVGLVLLIVLLANNAMLFNFAKGDFV